MVIMMVTCSRCNGIYQLASDCLPRNKSVVIWCPKCQDAMPSEGYAPENEKKPSSPTEPQYGEALKNQIVASFKKLCPMPHVMLKARRLLADEKSDFRQLSRIIKSDQALAARVLKVANSAFYGMKGKVSSLQKASVLIGSRVLTQIVTLVSTSKMLRSQLPGYGLKSGSLWRHSLRVAVGAEIIGRRCTNRHQNDAFIAGLLHDAGKIILDHQIRSRQAAFDAFTRSDPSLTVYAEQLLFGFDHADIGRELCIKWNLPEPVAEAIGFHHFPGASQANQLAYVVHLADHLAAFCDKQNETPLDIAMNRGILRYLSLTDADLSEILPEIVESVETLEEDTM